MSVSRIWSKCEDFETLLVAARRDSPGAVGKLLGECGDYLLLVANRELGRDLRTKVGASDIVQETFIKAHASFDQFRGEREHELLRWLRKILVRQIVVASERYRSAAKRDLSREVAWGDENTVRALVQSLPGDGRSPSSHASADEDARALAEAISRLPDDYRQVISLRYWEQLTFVEIGHRMRRSTDAAEKLWLRAITRLAAGGSLNNGDAE